MELNQQLRQAAKNRNEKTYLSTLTCVRNHPDRIRYASSGGCVACGARRSAEQWKRQTDENTKSSTRFTIPRTFPDKIETEEHLREFVIWINQTPRPTLEEFLTVYNTLSPVQRRKLVAEREKKRYPL